MIYRKIYLKDLYPELINSDAILEVYCYEESYEYFIEFKRYPLLILPGGGYQFCSHREKDPIAFAYLAQGYNCFSLTYSCWVKYPGPHIEVACAMDYIEKHCDEYHLYKNAKSIIGFSAGGHLAASYSCYYKELANLTNLDENDIKPIYQILGYPVTTFLSNTHEGTRKIITGDETDLIDKLSIEKHITKDYPPTYIWTTKEDKCVPISNSGNLYDALQEHGVISKYHLYPQGEHGRSTCTNETELNYRPLPEYMYDMQDWIKESFKFFIDNIIRKNLFN